jgi:TolB protein
VWSADMREKATHIVVTSLDTGTSQDLTPDARSSHESPRWSPNGQHIVFASARDDPTGARTNIFVMNTDGSQLRNLSRNSAENFDPKWSADGSRIVFVSLRTGTSLLYEVGLADGVTRALGQHLSHDMDHTTRPVAMLR